MEAGRELDALVHEKVMGLFWDERYCRVCGHFLAASREDGCVAGDCSMRPRPARRADEVPHYSTDINAAWGIIADGKIYGVWRWGDGEWSGLTEPLEQDEYWFGRRMPDARTAEHAICLAALRTVGIEP